MCSAAWPAHLPWEQGVLSSNLSTLTNFPQGPCALSVEHRFPDQPRPFEFVSGCQQYLWASRQGDGASLLTKNELGSIPRPTAKSVYFVVSAHGARCYSVYRRQCSNGGCSSMGRVLGCEPSGYAFDPRQSPHHSSAGSLAEWRGSGLLIRARQVQFLQDPPIVMRH